MLKRVLSAGDTVESQCTKCKALLNHTIVAMVGDKVVRVKCNTCGSEHNHRPVAEPKVAAPRSANAATASAPRATSRARSAKGAAQSDEAIWEELIRPFDPDQAVPYRMDGKFRAPSLLAHPTFGIGLVEAITSGKIEVVFKTGRKLLRCV